MAAMIATKRLCVPRTLSELMARWNRLSWPNDRAALFRYGHPGLAIQAEVASILQVLTTSSAIAAGSMAAL
jgi:hypothetical protein